MNASKLKFPKKDVFAACRFGPLKLSDIKKISDLSKSWWNYPDMTLVSQLEDWKSVNSRSSKVTFWVLWPCICQNVKYHISDPVISGRSDSQTKKTNVKTSEIRVKLPRNEISFSLTNLEVGQHEVTESQILGFMTSFVPKCQKVQKCDFGPGHIRPM